MSPAAIAIVSVVIFVVLMIAIKIVLGKVLHDKDQQTAQIKPSKQPDRDDDMANTD